MKTLLISHNSISTYDNMGKTLLSLFSGFSKDELCQLYIHPSDPDVEVCCSYYRITDKEAVVSSLLPFHDIGKVITEFEGRKNDDSPGRIRNRLTATKEAILLLFRDFFWKHSHWFNSRLKKWLKSQRPDCVFVAPGNSKFIYDIALKISRELSIPIITYICDDFYFRSGELNAVRQLNLRLLKGRIETLLSSSSYLITIADNMGEDYGKVFDVSSVTVMTGATIDRAADIKTGEVKNISYFGNLSLGRHVSLEKIGKALDKINTEMHDTVRLHVYSGDTNSILNDKLSKPESVILEGFVSGEEYDRAFSDADVLVHVESFDREYEERIKYSVSTKIADALASGKLLFAFGPSGIASMDYLQESGSAWTVTDPMTLDSEIIKMLTDPQSREELEKRALETAAINHDSKVNSIKVRSVINMVINSSSMKE